MKKKIMLILSLLLIPIILLGCSTKEHDKIYESDKQIAKVMNRHTITFGTGGLNGDYYKLKADTYVGIETLWKIQAEADTEINLDIELNSVKQNIKVVIVNSKDEVTTIVEGNAKDEFVVPISKGENYIKLLSKKDKIDVYIEIIGDVNSKIKVINGNMLSEQG